MSPDGRTTIGQIPRGRPRPMARMFVYGRLVRFSHTVFALPFALMAVFLAGPGWPGFGKLLLILACMVSARSAAMAFNRIADARIDSANPRTANRPIQAGLITLRQAKAFYALCCAAFVTACAGFWWGWRNPWPVMLSAAVLAFISGYSLAKRFTSLSHLFLGASLGLSPIAAWLAISPATFGLAPLVLGLAVLCWSAGFDIIYALQDIDIDRRQGLHSLPVRMGPARALWISRLLHVLTLALLLWLWRLAALGDIYLAGVGVAAGLLLVEQSLVRPGDYRRVNAAFFHANAAVSMLLALAAIADVLSRTGKL